MKVLTSAALGAVVAAVAAGVYWQLDGGDAAATAAGCPRGTKAIERAEGQPAVCIPKARTVADAFKPMSRDLARNGKSGTVPDGALRQAVAHKAAMAPLQAKVAGATGEWQEYGRGTLISGLERYSARVDNFAYDPVGQRLFAAVGTGGIWMSEAVGGDVTTLGNQWRSIGDGLPSQSNGAVAWTPAGGGRVIAVGGEAVMGSSGYLGLGAFWSDDLGQTWNSSTGVPDGALAFQAAVDPAHPEIIYAATSRGLFRSTDAGETFTNVALPTSAECAGVESISGPCLYANYVTDVVVQEPGGTTNVQCEAGGCPVVAAVGFRTGSTATYQDGTTVQAPGNGLYRSTTGAPGSFSRVDVAGVDPLLPVGFPPQERIGRIELGHAVGPEQDHNWLYAIVQDALSFNGNFPFDPGLDIGPVPLPILPFDTVLNGLYASSDFGATWTRMADAAELALNPSSGSALIVLGATGYGVGIQSWYNAWIKPDPTRALNGVPTRLTFGLEEVWQNRLTNVPLDGVTQSGTGDFEVIGPYFALTADTSTHPDQHGAIYIPTGDGGVCLFVGNDGGVYKQCVDDTGEMTVNDWGQGANDGFYALLPYGLGVAKDGTVWFGLQDNGSGHIEPDTREQIMDFGADGFYAEVDPDNSDIAYTESQNGGLVRTTNRGQSSTSIAPSYTRVMFDNWFRMDPLDAQHMVTGAQEVYETASAETVTGDTWVEVFNLGTNPDTGAIRTTTTMEVLGEAVYVGGCGDCGASGNDTGFQNVVATNVGGDQPPLRETSQGWHFATAAGLPNRYITSFAIDPENPRVVYATLAGYLSNLRPPGSFLDPNENIGAGNVFKSTDAGESFTNISGNLPNVQANSVVLRRGQLIVGTDIGAFISSDTQGSTWAPLGSTLPNTPVNMVRLRPGNDRELFAATFGRGIWQYTFPAEGGGGGDSPTEGRFGGGLPLATLTLLGLAALLRRRRG
ncbi:MAG TPA: hypothetical protein VFV27_00750 [Nevskiaceae bacterium]|nr:hypothetical protein [Nevskiaceae bacterium]